MNIRPTTSPAAHLLASRWEALLGGLKTETRQELARRATLRARALGLAVVREAGDVDIPLTLTPEVVEPGAISSRAVDARNVLSAVVKGARAVLAPGVDTPWARMLFGHFGPLESACLANWQQAEDVTIARVDWFMDASGRHFALELNATIPAMEAYSDAAARAWIETLADFAGLDASAKDALVALNGSNAEELRRSIVAHAGYAASDRPSIAIIHRAADSQLRELQALVRHFTEAGHQVSLTASDEVQLDSDERAIIAGSTPDILYRHIFARRMAEGSPLERIALGQTRARLQNPVNGQFEVKGLLAEVSRLVMEEGGAGLRLTEAETETIRTVVPWTRLLAEGRSLDPDGRPVENLAAMVAAEPVRFVLKRSWDYGGKSVLLGRDVVEAEGIDGWRKRVRDAVADGPGVWVVQKLVASPRRRHLVVQRGEDALWEEVFVDASTYSASGQQQVPGGGVARFARTGVVNIVGGGGVAPLISTPVAERLLVAAEAVASARG